ncbi:hypothetical protein GWK47_047573 [Chionoecetes opilio]|uniref:Uncharacterized protein n=1 Tax=Chionoecetes opilio TaxID=41210 RepID=A0A8J4Y551_CHIOP|nr:hypothetical protein GWK47_047573 [Chionoecetes opilio]
MWSGGKGKILAGFRKGHASRCIDQETSRPPFSKSFFPSDSFVSAIPETRKPVFREPDCPLTQRTTFSPRRLPLNHLLDGIKHSRISHRSLSCRTRSQWDDVFCSLLGAKSFQAFFPQSMKAPVCRIGSHPISFNRPLVLRMSSCFLSRTGLSLYVSEKRVSWVRFK